MQVWRTTSGRGFCWASELVLLLAFVGGCKKDVRPVVLVEVRDETEGPTRLTKPVKDALEKEAVKTVEGLPGFEFRRAKPDETGWQYVLTLELARERTADDNPDLMHRAAGMRAELIALKGGGRYQASVLETKDEAPGRPFSKLMEQALKKAAAELSATVELFEADDEKVLALLSGGENRLQRQAIVLAGERKLKKAVPKLMAIVRDEERSDDVVLKAVGALVAIGDPEATSAIIDAGRRRSSSYVLPLVFAVGQLGGREAEGYLFTVKNGHPDPAVRKAAEDALSELEARRAREKKPPPP